jgi:hypothetical protein
MNKRLFWQINRFPDTKTIDAAENMISWALRSTLISPATDNKFGARMLCRTEFASTMKLEPIAVKEPRYRD